MDFVQSTSTTTFEMLINIIFDTWITLIGHPIPRSTVRPITIVDICLKLPYQFSANLLVFIVPRQTTHHTTLSTCSMSWIRSGVLCMVQIPNIISKELSSPDLDRLNSKQKIQPSTPKITIVAASLGRLTDAPASRMSIPIAPIRTQPTLLLVHMNILSTPTRILHSLVHALVARPVASLTG